MLGSLKDRKYTPRPYSMYESCLRHREESPRSLGHLHEGMDLPLSMRKFFIHSSANDQHVVNISGRKGPQGYVGRIFVARSVAYRKIDTRAHRSTRRVFEIIPGLHRVPFALSSGHQHVYWLTIYVLSSVAEAL